MPSRASESLVCKCTVHRCAQNPGGGRTLSRTMLKRHRLDQESADVSRLFERAQDLSTQAVQAQIDDLSSQLAASTLSDEVSGPSNIPGGRLWGKESFSHSDESTASHSSLNSTPSIPRRPPSQHNISPPRDQERETLHHLRDVGEAVDISSQEIIADILALESSPFKHPSTVFPLEVHFESMAHLNDQLGMVSFKSPEVTTQVRNIKEKLDQTLDRLTGAKRGWSARLKQSNDERQSQPGIPFSTDHHFGPVLEGADPILQVTFFAIMACKVVFGIGLRRCNFLLHMLQYILHLSLARAGSLSVRDEKLLADVPRDFRSTAEEFHLDPQTTVTAVCPDLHCHATYDPHYEDGSPIPIYPETCSYRAFRDGAECGAQLLRPHHINGRTVGLPIKTFVRVSFKDWLGELLSRPGFEKEMDASWAKTRMDRSTELRDIFDGKVLREFKGPDGKHFSLGGNEGRYIFSLCVDYFNPLGNKTAGKSLSVGLVSIVCLNLPPEKRYKPENMFLYGIIPGPSEPPLDCQNHYLRFLIDELLEFWTPGVRFSRTYDHEFGRLVRCALICLVCDLLSARKTGGFTGVGSQNICAFCRCTLKEHGISNIDYMNWVPRTHTEYLASAKLYADTTDKHSRDLILEKTGIRWSELFRLPYFDPSRFIVVDAMHNLFLGLMKEHYEILGVRLNVNKEDHVAVPIHLTGVMQDKIEKLKKNPKSTIRSLHKFLQSPLSQRAADHAEYQKILKRIENAHLESLNLAFEFLPGIIHPSVALELEPHQVKKRQLAEAILKWRLTQIESAPSKTFIKGCILTRDEVHEIRADIARMSSPSWLTSVPRDLGEARHGKLKADQWRVLGTVYLPISLMRLWETPNVDDDDEALMRRKMLKATIALISAIRLATSDTTSHLKVTLYNQQMHLYLSLLKDLVPDYKLHPNHHMALHLGAYIHRFGPVHAWWAFPFERIIGMLQHIPINFKQGQLEETITKSFIRSANLRALLLKDGCPQAIANCITFFKKLTNPNIRNTALVDMPSFLSLTQGDDDMASNDADANEVADILPMPGASNPRFRISDTTQAALHRFLSESQEFVTRILQFHSMNGRTYCRHSRHQGNSSILIKTDAMDNPAPAQIHDIIQTNTGRILIAVQYHGKATARDPFETYPLLDISLWTEPEGPTKIISPVDIHSHFASCPFETEESEPHVAVISLSRAH